MNHDRVMIIDYGSQYTQLITRRVRELSVYSEIFPFDVSSDQIADFAPKAIILSGGPSSVYDKGAYTLSDSILNSNLPIFGICYGLQVLVHTLGGNNRLLKQRTLLDYLSFFNPSAFFFFFIFFSSAKREVSIKNAFAVATAQRGIMAMNKNQNEPVANKIVDCVSVTCVAQRSTASTVAVRTSRHIEAEGFYQRAHGREQRLCEDICHRGDDAQPHDHNNTGKNLRF